MARVWKSSVAIALPARIGGHVVDHLGLARRGDAADDPLPHRHPQAADLARGARPRTTRKNSSCRSSSSSQIELVSARQTSSAFSSASSSTVVRVQGAGELDADVEQRLVLGEAAVGLEAGPAGEALDSVAIISSPSLLF